MPRIPTSMASVAASASTRPVSCTTTTLTAWATAGILGPVIVNYMREYQLGLGIPREQVYNQTMLILAAMLMIGLLVPPRPA